MKLRIFCCEVFHREICSLVAASPHRCDVTFMPKGLHDLKAEEMRERLQQAIDAVEAARYDAIALAYGLCNNGTAGLRAPAIPMVVPRAHDCITLLLGSRSRYREVFDANPGTYYRSSGWIEREDAASANAETIPQRLGLFMEFEKLAARYGEDNARYIIETLGTGTQHYSNLAFIRMGIAGEDRFRRMAREEAASRAWIFTELEGDMGLLGRLVNGEWGDTEFLVLQPGETLAASYNDDVIRRQA